jgi:hypothetical protein
MACENSLAYRRLAKNPSARMPPTLAWLPAVLAAECPFGGVGVESEPAKLAQPAVYVHALRWVAGKAARDAATAIAAAAGDADAAGPELVTAAQAFMYAYSAAALVQWADGMAAAPVTPSPVAPAWPPRPGPGQAPVSRATHAVLHRLAAIYGLEALEKQLGLLVGVVSAGAAAAVRSHLSAACVTMRHDVLAVVEAWDFSDFVLNSSLGRADGDAYTHYLRRIRAQTGDVAGTPSYWPETIGAVLAAGRKEAGVDK